jgi:hypothetical protein
VAILKALIGLAPKFVTVIVCGTLVVLTFCEKVSEDGLKLIAEGRGVGTGASATLKT